MSFIQEKQNNDTKILSPSKLSELDRICSSYMDFQNPKFVVIDGLYYASLIVIHYNHEMEGLFLNQILALDMDIQISMYYDKQNSYDVIKELTYHIGNTGASIKTSAENQQDIEIMGSAFHDAKYIRKQLQVGEEDLFYLTLYIGTYAKTSEELEQNLQRIESVALSIGLTTLRANYRQESALKAVLPFLSNDSHIKKIASRNVLSSGLVSTYPFVSNELFDKDGVLLGINSFDSSIILFDRFNTEKYKNANMFVIGTSGSGKSYFIKLMINRNRFLNIQQFIIDPDREYICLCENLGGTILKLGTNQRINVFDIRKTSLEDGESFLRNKISKLNIFFSLLFDGLSNEEKSLLEEKIIQCYAQKGITEKNESLYVEDTSSKILNRLRFKNFNEMPKLEDLYRLLLKDKKLKKYATILKSYITGSMSFLNGETNVDVSNPLILVDVHDISEKEMPIVMFVVTDFLWDRIKVNRGEKKVIYLDEVWKMIQKNEATADFVFKMFKTIRKYGGAATAITQDISDFFLLEDGKYGRGILNNSSMKCMFQLEENDIHILKDIIHLSEEEMYRLVNMPRGTAIMHAGKNILMMDVIASSKEHALINTDAIHKESKMEDERNEKDYNGVRKSDVKL